jgi:hypothetical protein
MSNSSEADIESQTTEDTTSKMKQVPLGFIIPDHRVAGFISRYNMEPLSQRRGSSELMVNMHPYLAFERNHLERRMLRYLHKKKYTVMDVGSSPARVLRKNEDSVRCLIPILQPGDTDRRRGYEHNPRVCYHTFQQYLENVQYLIPPACNNCMPVDAITFVHSAYYIPPKSLLEGLLECQEMHAIGLVFPEISGTIATYGTGYEASYVYENGIITMRVQGNSHTYVHPKLPWDGQSHFMVDNRVISVNLMEKLGDTYWWKITLEDETVRPPVPTVVTNWESILLDESQIGPIQVPDVISNTTQSMVRLMEVEFNIDRLEGDGKHLIVWGSETVSVTIPRGAIAYVANNVVYRERTPALLASATFYAKGYITRSSLPIEYHAHAIAACAILGLSVNVAVESRLLHHATKHQSAWWKTHKQLLEFAPIKVYSVYTVLMIGICLLIADLVTDHYIHTPNHEIAWVGLLVVLAAIGLMYSLYYYSKYVYDKTAKGWATELRAKQRASYVDVSTYVPPLFVPPNTNYKPPPTQDPDATITIKLDPKPPKNPGKPTERMRLEGVAVSDVVPTVVQGTQASELAGMMGRMAILTPTVTEDGLKHLHQALDFIEFKTVTDQIRIVDDSVRFEQWLTRDAIPSRLRDTYRGLRTQLLAEGIVPRDADMRSFVKVEKRVDITLDGVEAVNPRIISNPSDIHKVATGSFLWHFSNALCEVWNGYTLCKSEKPAGPVYTRGMTGEGVGRLVSAHLHGEYFQELLVLENDGEKFDAHIKDECTNITNGVYAKTGASPATLQAFKVERTKTVSRHGIKLQHKKKILFSGTNETNVKGTFINALIHVCFLSHVLSVTFPEYLMLLLGDDNTTFLPLTAEMYNTKLIIDYFKTLGFTMTPMIRRHLWDVEFCSRIFLPCSGGLVLSPKPGRQLAKMGWTISDEANLKGSLLSIRQDCAHVPFLRVYVKWALKMVSSDTKPKFDKRKDYMFHLEKSYDATNETWEFFYQRYGLTIKHEQEFEKELLEIKKLPAVVQSSYIKTLHDIDAGKVPTFWSTC